MIHAARLVVLAAVGCALGGCANAPDRYGSPAWSLVCPPDDPVLGAMVSDAPLLPAWQHRELQPGFVDVPELRPLHGTLSLDGIVGDAPLLAAPQRTFLPERAEDPLVELPPSRGAPWLPATSRAVPTLAAPQRGDVLPASAPVPELPAPTRAIELGKRYGPALDQPNGCAPALGFASIACLVPARADWREPPRRNP